MKITALIGQIWDDRMFEEVKPDSESGVCFLSSFIPTLTLLLLSASASCLLSNQVHDRPAPPTKPLPPDPALTPPQQVTEHLACSVCVCASRWVSGVALSSVVVCCRVCRVVSVVHVSTCGIVPDITEKQRSVFLCEPTEFI